MKKIIIFITILSIFIIFGIYKMVNYQDLSSLDKYKLHNDEEIYKEFSYKKYHYVITNYHDNTSSYYHHHILLKSKSKYYLLDTLNKCDISDYLNSNEYYIHCIGKEDFIKYTFNGTNLKKEILKFNFKEIPNTSLIHITITNVGNNYIYLSSNVKIDESIKEGNRVKCNIKTTKCEYN